MTDLNLNDVSVESLMNTSVHKDTFIMSPTEKFLMSPINQSNKSPAHSPTKLRPTLGPKVTGYKTKFPMIKEEST